MKQVIREELSSIFNKECPFSLFKHNNLYCVVVRTTAGHFCGYVGLPESHILYKVNYSSQIKVPKVILEKPRINEHNWIAVFVNATKEDRAKDEASIDCVFDVHGGITFSDNTLWYIQNECLGKLWWFGWDAAHYNDKSAFRYDDELFTSDEGEYRTVEFCIDQTKQLADQLFEYNKIMTELK